MNIIISSLDANGMKVTGASQADINSAKLFIAKSLNVTPLRLELILDNFIYSLKITANPSYDKANFYAYGLSAAYSIPLDNYKIKLYYQGITRANESLILEDEVALMNDLEDEHTIFAISDRTIARITTQIIAEDRHSQQISFSLKKLYDGISFLNDDKKIYVDYIPVDFVPYEVETIEGTIEKINFLSTEITEKLEDGENVILKWNVPSDAMQKSGFVKFAISVIDLATEYVWQTSPSQFIVLPNLGKRLSSPIGSTEEISAFAELAAKVNELEDDVAGLEEIVGFQSDNDISNDEEVIFSGGTAPKEE